MSDIFEAYQINETLRTLYGLHEETDKPRFRVVWSEGLTEKRFGNFEVYSDSGIYLRTDTNCVREVPKYPHLENQWVLERLQPNERKDVMEGSYIYESLWAFPSHLPLKLEPIEFVVKKSLEILPQHELDKLVKGPRTQKEAEEQHKEHLQKESDKILNMLDGTALQSQLHLGEAVQVPDMSRVIQGE